MPPIIIKHGFAPLYNNLASAQIKIKLFTFNNIKAEDGIRTRALHLGKVTTYRLSTSAKTNWATRTRTLEQRDPKPLRPSLAIAQYNKWGDRRDLNPRVPEPKSCALTTSPPPPSKLISN